MCFCVQAAAGQQKVKLETRVLSKESLLTCNGSHTKPDRQNFLQSSRLQGSLSENGGSRFQRFNVSGFQSGASELVRFAGCFSGDSLDHRTCTSLDAAGQTEVTLA